jgi:hypothetical protein
MSKSKPTSVFFITEIIFTFDTKDALTFSSLPLSGPSQTLQLGPLISLPYKSAVSISSATMLL